MSSSSSNTNICKVGKGGRRASLDKKNEFSIHPMMPAPDLRTPEHQHPARFSCLCLAVPEYCDETEAEKPSGCELMPLILLTGEAAQQAQAVVFEPAVRHNSLFAS
ncbi:MAG: hypothetical protein U9N41_04550 [Euryarchaeota archaeon]|nr:hypothetical protein [Euryarchaeota archaeon]